MESGRREEGGAFLIFEKGRVDLEVGPGWGRSRAGFAFDPGRAE